MMDSPEEQERKLQRLARFLDRKMKRIEKLRNQLKNNSYDRKERND
jgi:cell division protein ZapA (FtsZ GTPase activity inhibitor)